MDDIRAIEDKTKQDLDEVCKFAELLRQDCMDCLYLIGFVCRHILFHGSTPALKLFYTILNSQINIPEGIDDEH